MIYGSGRFSSSRTMYVIRRDGVSSAYLYLGPADAVGNRDWVEDLTEAAVFNIVGSWHYLSMFKDAFDGSVVRLTTNQAERAHYKQEAKDCVRGF